VINNEILLEKAKKLNLEASDAKSKTNSPELKAPTPKTSFSGV